MMDFTVIAILGMHLKSKYKKEVSNFGKVTDPHRIEEFGVNIVQINKLIHP